MICIVMPFESKYKYSNNNKSIGVNNFEHFNQARGE